MLLAITFLFCVIALRFFWVQVVDGGELVVRAEDQWNREIPVVAARGRIYDRNGRLLAGNAQSFSVFVRPGSVTDKEHAARVLAELFGVDEETLLKKLTAERSGALSAFRKKKREFEAAVATAEKFRQNAEVLRP